MTASRAKLAGRPVLARQTRGLAIFRSADCPNPQRVSWRIALKLSGPSPATPIAASCDNSRSEIRTLSGSFSPRLTDSAPTGHFFPPKQGNKCNANYNGRLATGFRPCHAPSVVYAIAGVSGSYIRPNKPTPTPISARRDRGFARTRPCPPKKFIFLPGHGRGWPKN
jgi:hypothetical protein